MIKFERKVLRIFGRVIRPANWTIFISGAVLIPVGLATLWLDLSLKILGAILISLQGVDFLISGYGNVKADEEDLDADNVPS
jgi:hypothetical protein